MQAQRPAQCSAANGLAKLQIVFVNLDNGFREYFKFKPLLSKNKTRPIYAGDGIIFMKKKIELMIGGIAWLNILISVCQQPVKFHATEHGYIDKPALPACIEPNQRRYSEVGNARLVFAKTKITIGCAAFDGKR